MTDDIKIRLIERGETTVEVPADVYDAAKEAGELDQLFDCEASDIDGKIVVVEPDGTRVNYSTAQVIEPPKASDLPVMSIVAGLDKLAIRGRAFGPCPWWPLVDGVQHNETDATVDAWLAGDAEVLRVGTGEA